MKSKAPKFSTNTLKFIIKASKQKRADWLDKNHDEYESVLLAPLKHLASFVQQNLKDAAEGYHFPQKGIGRIRRSANRVKEWGMYKDWVNYSASRPHPSRFESNPNLYFEIDPTDKDGDHVLVAGGLYVPSSQQVRMIRQAIAQDASEFDVLFATKEFKKRFKGGFSKDRISTRNPRGFDPNHPKLEWLKLQAFFVWRPCKMSEFTSPKFAKIVADDFRQILKLNALLEKAIQGGSKKSASAFKATVESKAKSTSATTTSAVVARTPDQWDF